MLICFLSFSVLLYWLDPPAECCTEVAMARHLVLFLILKGMFGSKLQLLLYIFVRCSLLTVPIVYLILLSSKGTLYCLSCENGDGPFKYFSFDGWHELNFDRRGQ